MEKRTLYYWSRIYSVQMQKGMPYTELAKTTTKKFARNWRRSRCEIQ
ncbi:PD-(D/E)XK nuclease family transposase [Brevibacillus sp. SAFN-007a]